MVTFLSRMRSIAKKDGRVEIDFRNTRRMYPAGTLLFRAEVDRLAAAFGRKTVRAFKYPADQVVEQVLQHVGIARILGLPSRFPAEMLAENVKHWRFATGVLTEGESVAPLLDRYQGRIATSLSKHLYAGIVEAMANALAHAYIADRGDGIDAKTMGRRWWMFSQELEGQLSVTFCDLGIGIPASLASSKKWAASVIELIIRALGPLAPAVAARIKAAIEVGKTRTRKSYRGRGLNNVLEVVRNATTGGLTILSDCGLYTFDSKTGTEKLEDFDENIMATILEWTIPLTGESE